MTMAVPIPALALLALLALPAPHARSQEAEAPAAERIRFFRGYLGDLALPTATAIAADGRVVVTEAASRSLAVFEPSGRLAARWTAAGGFDLAAPAGVAVGSDGAVYVSDATRSRVGVFGPQGEHRRWIGGPDLLDAPCGLDVAGGRLLVADRARHVVEEFDLDGGHVRTLGRPGTGPGELMSPRDVALGADGRAYVADSDNDRVQVFAADGSPLFSFGGFGPFPGMFAGPAALEARAGMLFVADRANHRVQVFDLDGQPLYEWGIHALRPGEGEGRLHYPSGLAVAADGGRAIVVEPFDRRCQRFGAEPNEAAGEPMMSLLTSIAPSTHYGMEVSRSGHLMAINSPEGHCVLVFDVALSDPRLITTVGARGAKTGLFLRPSGVFLDSAARTLAVTDPTLRRLSLFALDVSPEDEVGFDPLMWRFVRSLDFGRLFDLGLAGGLAAAPEPGALTRDRAGRFYVCDRRNDCVLVLSPAFELVRTIGGRGAAPGSFRRPSGVALDSRGERLLVVDAGNRRVQALDLAGEPLLVFATPADADGRALDSMPYGIAAGRDGFAYVSDVALDQVLKYDERSGELKARLGAPGILRAQFNGPRGVAQDESGALTVADHGNHRGHLISAAGEYVGVFGARQYTRPARLQRPVGEDEE